MHVDSDEAKTQIATQFQIGAPRILLHPLCLLSSEESSHRRISLSSRMPAPSAALLGAGWCAPNSCAPNGSHSLTPHCVACNCMWGWRWGSARSCRENSRLFAHAEENMKAVMAKLEETTEKGEEVEDAAGLSALPPLDRSDIG